jgi:hypothetical protein
MAKMSNELAMEIENSHDWGSKEDPNSTRFVLKQVIDEKILADTRVGLVYERLGGRQKGVIGVQFSDLYSNSRTRVMIKDGKIDVDKLVAAATKVAEARRAYHAANKASQKAADAYADKKAKALARIGAAEYGVEPGQIQVKNFSVGGKPEILRFDVSLVGTEAMVREALDYLAVKGIIGG